MSVLIKFNKGEHKSLSPNFNSKEFECSCNYAECKENIVSQDLVDALQKVRDELSKSIKITSGYRCEKKQEDLKKQGYETAKGISSHQLGIAVDITNGDIKQLLFIVKKYFKNIGEAKTFIHIDLREGGPRYWTYK